MALKKCNFCDNKVPDKGQCNSCGFIDGIQRQPSDDDFREARKINEDHKYEQYTNIDMLLLDM